jgi:ubiquinone/menaquinone biosynthesis C-methylase UbiE
MTFLGSTWCAGSALSTKQYYDESASSYDSVQNLLFFKIYDSITWRFTEPYLPSRKTALVLDAAGGTGKWSIPIAKKGPRVVLLDMSNGMLEIARRKISDQSLSDRVETRQGDITNLHFDDETFDLVFCEHALGFFNDARKALTELVRVLKRGSTMVVSAQNRYPLALSLFNQNMDTGMKILGGEEPFLMRGRVPVHTLFPSEFHTMLEQCGLRVTKLIGKGIVLTPLVLPMERLYMDKFDQDFYDKIMRVEVDLCEKPDALALAGHIQAIGTKK